MSGMQDIQVGSSTTPPLISPVVAEADGAEHFLGTVHNQFKPDTDQAGIAPPGNWPQIAPVASIGSQHRQTSLTCLVWCPGGRS